MSRTALCDVSEADLLDSVMDDLQHTDSLFYVSSLVHPEEFSRPFVLFNYLAGTETHYFGRYYPTYDGKDAIIILQIMVIGIQYGDACNLIIGNNNLKKYVTLLEDKSGMMIQ